MYGDISIDTFKYNNISASGGSVTPTLSWRQKISDSSGVVHETQNQGSVSFFLFTNKTKDDFSVIIDKTTGVVTCRSANQQTTPLMLGTVTVAIQNGGKTAQGNCNIIQNPNVQELQNPSLYYTRVFISDDDFYNIVNGNTTMKDVFDSKQKTYVRLDYNDNQLYDINFEKKRGADACIMAIAMSDPTAQIMWHDSVTNADYSMSTLSDFTETLPQQSYYEQTGVTITDTTGILATNARLMLVLQNQDTSEILTIIVNRQ